MALEFLTQPAVRAESNGGAAFAVQAAHEEEKQKDPVRVRRAVILRCGIVFPQNITPALSVPGTELKLEREPDNKYDRWAIKVLGPDGVMLGYLPSWKNQSAARLMDAGKNISVFVDESFSPTESHPMHPGREDASFPLILYMDIKPVEAKK